MGGVRRGVGVGIVLLLPLGRVVVEVGVGVDVVTRGGAGVAVLELLDLRPAPIAASAPVGGAGTEPDLCRWRL